MSNDNTFIDYYRVLHVDHNADPLEIYESYSKLIKKYFPSKRNLAKLETDEEKNIAEVMFQLVKDAGATLNNEEKRKAYNEELRLNNTGKGGDSFQNLRGSYQDFIKNIDTSHFQNVKMIDTISVSKFHTKEDNGTSNIDVISERLNELKKQKEIEEAELASNVDLRTELESIKDDKEYMKRFNHIFHDKNKNKKTDDFSGNRFDKFVGSFGNDPVEIQEQGIMPFTDWYPSSAIETGDITSCDFFGTQGQIVDDGVDNYHNIGLHEKYADENEASLRRAFEIPFIPVDDNLEKESTADAFARMQKERGMDIMPTFDTQWKDLPISRHVGFMVGNSHGGKELPYTKTPSSKNNFKTAAYETLIR